MIHHYSVSVPDPKSTIEKLKCLFGGKITRFGPLEGGYILWFGDQHGTAIELYPSGAEMFPGKKGEQAQFQINPKAGAYCATHAAISVGLDQDQIMSFAEEMKWKADELPRGGFSVIELWIENVAMIEVLTPEMAKDYLSVTQKIKLRPEL